MLSRRGLLKAIGLSAAGAAACSVAALPAQQPFGPKETRILELFERDPVEALALTKAYLRADPNWTQTRGFFYLAIGPFGKWVSDCKRDEWDAVHKASKHV